MIRFILQQVYLTIKIFSKLIITSTSINALRSSILSDYSTSRLVILSFNGSVILILKDINKLNIYI